MRARLALGSLFAVALFSVCALAALTFPQLTGRVVDDAHILSSATVAELDQKLAAYENGTGNQVVVVTLRSLQNRTIEEYGYQLGRTWKIGQKDKNNGVLLIVAPHERKVRIEVGYGLEPVLTDAASSVIVQNVILPQFRAGHMEEGVVEGTEAILTVLGGKSIQGVNVPDQSLQLTSGQWIFVLLIFLFFSWFAMRHPLLTAILFMGRGGGYGGGDGGGFSGGGGSFGGGGSSGSW